MSERVPIDPERLLAQTAWVRRLARSLARDEASADDLMQDSLVTALRQPPGGERHEERLRAWFHRVLRNLAIRRARTEQRRAEREHLGAAAEAREPNERAAELEDLRTQLFRHVQALPGELRDPVLLRFFEELDSAEIARRLGVPDSTVRNRLRRALAELRGRLEREHGADWRNLCLFALPTSGAKVATGAALAAAGGLWLGGGVVVLAALALVLWIGMHDASHETHALADVPVEIPHSGVDSATRSDGAQVPPPLAEADTSRTIEAGALRVVISDSYEPPPTTPFAHGIIVYGVVRDENGEPINGGGVGWTDAWGRGRGAAIQEGKYSSNSLSPGLQIVRVTAPSCVAEIHEISLAPDKELQSFDFELQRAHVVPVYIVDPEGKSLLDGTIGEPLILPGCPTAVLTREPPPATMIVSIGEVENNDHHHPGWRGILERWERDVPVPPGALGLLEIGGEPPYFVSLVHRGRVLSTQRLETIPERVTFAMERTLFEQPLSRLVAQGGYILTSDGMWRDASRGRILTMPTSVPVHLQFLDDAARPVMAWFKLTLQNGVEGSQVWSNGAHANGRFDWELEPGHYVMQVTGTREDDDPNFTRVGALPRHVEITTEGPNEILVPMSPLRFVLLRSRCPAEEWFRWRITTCDDLPVTDGELLGHAPKSVGLPVGHYVLHVRQREEDQVAAEQEFEVGDEAPLLELVR